MYVNKIVIYQMYTVGGLPIQDIYTNISTYSFHELQVSKELGNNVLFCFLFSKQKGIHFIALNKFFSTSIYPGGFCWVL